MKTRWVSNTGSPALPVYPLDDRYDWDDRYGFDYDYDDWYDFD